MSAGELTIYLIWLVETVQRSIWYLFNQYLPTAGGNLHQSWPATIFTFWFVFLSLLTRLSLMFNLPLSSRSCDDMDSESAKESSQKISGAKLWGAQILVHVDRIWDFHETMTFVILKNWWIQLTKLICAAFQTSTFIGVLRCVQYSSFRRSHVYGPWVVILHDAGACDFGWWILNLNTSMSAGELTIDLIWLAETAQRSSWFLSKQYLSMGRRRFARIMASNSFNFLVCFFVCARTSVVHFQFPFV